MQLGNHDFTFVLEGDNLLKVVVTDSASSEEQGTPIRFKISTSGGRVAADFPGVSDSHFITTGEHGGPGSISNG